MLHLYMYVVDQRKTTKQDTVKATKYNLSIWNI